MATTFPDGSTAHTTYDHLADGTVTAVDYLVDTSGSLSHVVAEITDLQVSSFYIRAHDQILSRYRPADGSQRYFHTDGLGSVVALSDPAGVFTDRYSYTAFGELREHSGSDPNPYLFAGEPFEPASALYYNRSRWLEPATGRFVSADSFEGSPVEPLSLHKYAYAHDNPVQHVDPSGKSVAGVGAQLGMLAFRGITFPIAFGTIGYSFARLRSLSHAQAWEQAKQSGGIGFLFIIPIIGAAAALYFLGGFVWAALNGELEALDYWELATYLVVGLAL